MRTVVLLIAVVLCAASGATQKTYTPEVSEAPEGVTDKDLYAAAVQVFTEHDWGVADKDVDGGIVTSGWIVADSSAIAGVTVFHAWRVMISEGEIKIAIDCQIKNNGSIDACSANTRVQSFADQEPSVRGEIVAEASRRARNRKARETPPAETPEPAPDIAAPAAPDAGM